MYKYIYTHMPMYIYFHVYLSIENHEFSPIPPIPVQHHRLHFNLPLSIFVTAFTNSEKIGFHYPHNITYSFNFIFTAQYVTNVLATLGPVLVPPGPLILTSDIKATPLSFGLSNPCWPFWNKNLGPEGLSSPDIAAEEMV